MPAAVTDGIKHGIEGYLDGCRCDTCVGAPHGTYAYRRGCRCEVCVAANYAAQKSWRERAGKGPIPPTAHGTVNGYLIYGCREDCCVSARRESWRQERRARRRMAALVARGLPRDWEGQIEVGGSIL